MIDILAAIGHWCASCVPASVGVAPALGALGGAAAAAAGISGLGDLASDGGVGDVSGAPSGAGSGAGALARTLEPVSPLALGLAQKPEVPARTAP